jgi:hypothetical protein
MDKSSKESRKMQKTTNKKLLCKANKKRRVMLNFQIKNIFINNIGEK